MCTHTHAHTQALQSIKASLMEGLYSTGRGAHATSEQRAVAEERISALECRNPNNRPTEVSTHSHTHKHTRGWANQPANAHIHALLPMVAPECDLSES